MGENYQKVVELDFETYCRAKLALEHAGECDDFDGTDDRYGDEVTHLTRSWNDGDVVGGVIAEHQHRVDAEEVTDDG